MNLHIEKIGWEQLETVYHTYMVPDFDGHGLKPLSAIRYLWDKGCYEGIFLYEGTDLRAYALFVADRETGYLLLDYFKIGWPIYIVGAVLLGIIIIAVLQTVKRMINGEY